jgi:hypothetical protein
MSRLILSVTVMVMVSPPFDELLQPPTVTSSIVGVSVGVSVPSGVPGVVPSSVGSGVSVAAGGNAGRPGGSCAWETPGCMTIAANTATIPMTAIAITRPVGQMRFLVVLLI